MAYALRAQVEIFFVGAGAGPMSALTPPSLPGLGGGTGQIKQFDTNAALVPIVPGAGAGGALAAADITALLASLSADMSTQMNAAIVVMQGWVSGQP